MKGEHLYSDAIFSVKPFPGARDAWNAGGREVGIKVRGMEGGGQSEDAKGCLYE